MRILLADNQSKVRSALRLLLEQQGRASVVGEATNAEEVCLQIEQTRPDLVLLDWDLPGRAMPELISALRGEHHNLHVMILSWRAELRGEALEAGAEAFISKTDPPERLLAAIGSFKREV